MLRNILKCLSSGSWSEKVINNSVFDLLHELCPIFLFLDIIFWNLFSYSRDMEVAHTNIIAHIIEALNYIWMGKLIFYLSRPSSFGRWSEKEKYNWWKVCGRSERKQNVFWSIQEASIMKMELTVQFKVGITSLSKRREVIV